MSERDIDLINFASSKHFFSGELLFQTRPNYDSLQPSISFIEADIKKIIESFEWK